MSPAEEFARLHGACTVAGADENISVRAGDVQTLLTFLSDRHGGPPPSDRPDDKPPAGNPTA
jgi:hypothetical protein